MQGNVVFLNGVPRSGKTSVAQKILEISDEVWVHLGVDQITTAIHEKFTPTMGLRPGKEFPEKEKLVQQLYLALFDSIRAFSNQRLHVVVDVGFHQHYQNGWEPYEVMKERLNGLPVYHFSIYCPIDEVIIRREQTWGTRIDSTNIPTPILQWHQEVYKNQDYISRFDTSKMSAEEIGQEILRYVGGN
ncbi:phosphotransferase-like protein [Alkalihalobacillus pseudalcaliphilus]|uniref:phosphotransferase-like protein n=1 Tax=Alkalihalobacillus pseudalcaliphilus TaxID=79884 RepID=UPI000A706907|nr:hypothetical protein [Alkalihalobacillus pseudalcaliphilus]